MKVFFDDFDNKAVIKAIKVYPYNGAPEKVEGYELSLYALYDDGYMYHRSIHGTEGDAEYRLSGYSCGTFKCR